MGAFFQHNTPLFVNNKISTILIFISSLLLLILYLFCIRFNVFLPVHFFWISICAMFGCILYQSLKVDLTSNIKNIILLELSLTSCAFHLIYQIPYYGLRGSDTYHDLNSMKGILLSGFLRGDLMYLDDTAYWPIIHILGTESSLITGWHAFNIAKWLPSIIGIILPICLYLFINLVFKNQKVALVSTLFYISIQHNILFGSLFIRESIALIFEIIFLYIYFSDNTLNKKSLAILFLITITLSHHLTSFLLIIFFIVYLSYLSILSPKSKGSFSKFYYGNVFTKNIFSLVCLIPITYCIYIAIQPLEFFISFMNGIIYSDDISTYAQIANFSFSSINNFRSYILYIGFYFFNIIFGAILLCQLILTINQKKLEVYSFTTFHLLMGFFGILFLYAVPTNVAYLYPDRFLSYGWLFGCAPLVLFIENMKNKWLHKMGVILLALFLLYNIYSIEPAAWNPSENDLGIAPSEEDYAFAEKFNFNDNISLGAHQNTLMAIYDIHNYLGSDLFLPTSASYNKDNFHWIILHKKALRLKINNNSYLSNIYRQIASLDCDTSMNKVYDTSTIASYSKG